MKYLGCLFILIFFLLNAFRSCSRAKREAKEVSELLSLIRCLSSRIGYFNEPLPDIYASFEADALEECGFLLHLREGADANDAVSSLCVSDETKKGLIALLSDLGWKGASESLAALSLFEDHLREEDERLRSSLPSRIKVERTLALSAAILLLILII